MSTTPLEHSPIGASSHYRWKKSACPGSVRECKGMPNLESDHARKGTFAHDKAAEYLIHGTLPSVDAFEEEEEYEAVMFYADAIFEARKGATFCRIEERFSLSTIHPRLYGTGDCVIYHSATKTLQVWDYKHGKGIPVEVENNGQLKYYGLGALLKTGVPCENIELVICQPRCPHPDGPIRKWTISVMDLLEFSADLEEDALATEDPNAPLRAGEHCRFCSAAPVCPELKSRSLVSAQQDFAPEFSYDPAKLSETLTLLPAIEAWCKSVKAFAYHEANTGKDIPGYKLVPKRANRKWINEGDAEDTLLLQLGLSYDDVKKVSLKSPAQIEALLSKENKKILERLTVKESSGSTLVAMSDKRAPLSNSVETDFTVINPLLE